MMKKHLREYVMLETKNRTICLEMSEDGAVSLETKSKALKDRCAQARVLCSADCHQHHVTMQQVKKYVGDLHPDCKTFACDLFGFLSGQPLSEKGSLVANHHCEELHQNPSIPCQAGSRMVASPSTSEAPCVDRSVPFGEDARILEQFREDGFVVVTGVFSDELVTSAINELWESPCLLGRDKAVRRDNRSTWGSEHWPQQDGGRNFVASLDPYQEQACWEFTQHPNSMHVMRLLWRDQGVEDLLLPEPPRWGVMRPTARNPEWRTDESWLHWDQNPWTQPGFGRVQAFACLSDQTPTTGGLLCVPGFHRRWRQWGESHPEGTLFVDGKQLTRAFGNNQPFPVPSDDPVHNQVVRVLAPRGSLVLWDGRLPHQNFPNTGEDFRMVIYLTFCRASEAMIEQRKQQLCRKLLVMRTLDRFGFWPQGLTSLGRAITGSPDVDSFTEADLQLKKDPRVAPAIKLAFEAGEEELKGNLHASIEKFRQSEKLYPDIGKWHDVIFA
mmetsp:Transcript_56588/g.106626  ORF Transcript_56588/g.106626 Transcript_56588/m.106626 type:complete len:499 (-) Transcript_56588:124-1620(-)